MLVKRIFITVLTLLLITQGGIKSTGKAEENQPITDLQADLAQYIKPYQGKVTLRYQNLVTNEGYSLNSNTEVPAASTIKLPLALFVMKLADEGQIDLNETLTYQSRHYYGGSGVIQNDKVGSVYTIDELVEKALIYSDNIAFIMLKERVRPNQFVSFLKSLGAEYAYPGGRNTTSADDLTLYTEELYRYANQSVNGKKLVQYLEHTVYNTTIPQGIKDVPVAHKVGMIPMNLIYNDAAIVFADEPYTLAITTRGIAYERSQEVIAEIASIINNHHQLIAKERSEKLAITAEAKIGNIPLSFEKGSFYYDYLERKMFGNLYNASSDNGYFGGYSSYQQLVAIQIETKKLRAPFVIDNFTINWK
ncbi:serine hydrolase [Bacillus sp. 1P10SD]|uniref:serine hydrolase n=1 Tax=Bacillus sp. 1P10SD TaxID=3132265 RepID=UPI0039A400FC